MASSGGNQDPRGGSEAKRVLIIDDHEVARDGLRGLVETSVPGAGVAEATTYEEAVERLGSGDWNLVLLDVDLPGKSGLELLGKIHHDWPHVPVLVVSASSDIDLGTPSLRRGASGYVCKRSPKAEIALAIQKVVAGGRYVSRELAEHLACTATADPAAGQRALSAREVDVLRYVAKGLSLREIAERLGVSEKTVATYRARIGSKLGLSSSVELTRYALRHGLAD